ncbi:uncharacterized protein [Triticum aestivum]|uniref:uncharacterized protein isoform X3 n=1 Tax=Triticum aestivum TaxID=4565 RepID=UPI001D01B44A|nr:uncharacterized protein LOC123062755 isoform X3 [Triticum aestivum]
MSGFREVVQMCGLSDLGYTGLPYTWDNRQEGGKNIKVRLADIDQQQQGEKVKAKKMFRYEDMWRREPCYYDIIKKSWWCKGEGLQDLMKSLSFMKESLQRWSFQTFGSVRGQLAQLRSQLEEVRRRSWQTGPSLVERSLMGQISELLAREEIMMRQQSRVGWLFEGDRNTSFFHSRCKERARQNRIKFLQRLDGTICYNQKEMEEETNQFFIKLFSAQDNLSTEEVINYVPTKVSNELNDMLCRPFLQDEVEQALFMMKPNKSPGLDGFTAGFYQNHWDILKPSICAAVLKFLNDGELPEEVNKTILVLIPKATKQAAERIQEILNIYNKGSGQLVNKSKSAIFFSSNSTDQMKEEVMHALDIRREALEEKYLGLPTALRRSTTGAFEKLCTRVSNMAGTGLEKRLSSAGREVFIKVVMQAVPLYSMSCFNLSKTTCKKLTTSMSRFWWGGDGDKQKLHWKKWDEIAQPKGAGGMGFRNLQLFNLAMLGKQGWRLITKPESLCSRVMAGKYYHGTDFLNAKKKKGSSHVWQAILKGRTVLQLGLIKRIGDGLSTNIWKDRWIPRIPGGKPIFKSEEVTVEKVSELINDDGKSWNIQKLNSNLSPMEVNEILKIPLGRLDQDLWAWGEERHGIYTVKSAYRALAKQFRAESQHHQGVAQSSTIEENKLWKKLWNLSIPPKVKTFWWRVIKGFMPVKAISKKRHIEKLSNCVECGANEDTIFHALIECSYARVFWNLFKKLCGIKLPKLHHLTWAQDILDDEVCATEKAGYILCGMWSVWTS